MQRNQGGIDVEFLKANGRGLETMKKIDEVRNEKRREEEERSKEQKRTRRMK